MLVATWLSGDTRAGDGDSGRVEVILDGINKESVEQLVGLMEEYMDAGYYMSPIGLDRWFLVPLNVLDGGGFFN